MLELQNLEYEILRDKVVRDFSLKVGAGEVVTLFGASGCGKTTILRLISGLIDPRKGKIINKFTEFHAHFIARRVLINRNFTHCKIGITEINAAGINSDKYFIYYIDIQRRTKLDFASLLICELD